MGDAALLALAALAAVSVSSVSAQGTASDGTVAPDFNGPCTVSATIVETGVAIDPKASGGVYTAPLQGSASYEGSIAVAAEERPINGQVSVATPPGIPSFTLKSWQDDDADSVTDSGTVTWDIPSFVPRGVIVTVSGYHNDAGARCDGSIQVKIEGGFFDSPVGPASLVLTVLFGLGMLFAAVPTVMSTARRRTVRRRSA